jgi:hypothetical protein
VQAIIRSSNPHGAELIAATQAVIDALERQ